MAAVVLVAYLIAASPLAGPAGLVPSSNAEFTVKTAMGALVAAGLVAPLVLDRPDDGHRFLGSAPMVTLGRWSYGIFIWHLAALTMVFPVIGQFAVPRTHARGADADAGLHHRDFRGELCAGRIAMPGSIAALGISPQVTP